MPIRVQGITVTDLTKGIGAFVKQATIDVFNDEVRDSVNHDGFDPKPVVVTDGVYRKNPNDVKPFGKIVAVARPNYVEVVRWALTALQQASPVRTGRYASSHLVMLNGAEITGDIWTALANTADGDKVQIVNFQPYARKIEGATASRRTGRGKRRPSSRQAKSGVYRKVLSELVSRYSKSMFFDFKYVKLPVLGVKVWGVQGGPRGKHPGHQKRTKVQRDQVYPALQFFIKPDASVLPN